MSFTFFFLTLIVIIFFNTNLFPNNSISLIIPKLIRNLTSSQLKIFYIYSFFSVFLYIYMHNFFIYDFFLSLFLFSFFYFFGDKNTTYYSNNFFLSPLLIISLYLSFLFAVEYFIKTTLLQVCLYSLFLFLWFCLWVINAILNPWNQLYETL